MAPSEKPVIFDPRVMIWFFSWLFGLFSCTAIPVLVLSFSTQAMTYVGDYPIIIVGLVVAGFLFVCFAVAPWYFGIWCRNCGKKLSPMKTECDPTNGNLPLRFDCEDCGIIWETKLISGPGDSSSISHL